MRKFSAVLTAAAIGLSTVLLATTAAAVETTPITEPVGEDSAAWRQTIAESPYRDRIDEVNVWSESMGRDIPVALVAATDAEGNRIENAPSIYLLNGAGGAEQGMDWFTVSNALDFYADKPVNLIVPMSGAFSYYVDWYSEPNGSYDLQGPQMWETFLTTELPEAAEGHLNASDQRGVIGFSMSATSSLLLAEHNPGFYDAVGSFSGCAATSDPVSYALHGVTGQMNMWGADMTQMFGPQGSEHNRYNDALVNAEALRGTELYISNGSGLAGRSDQQSHLHGQLGPNVPQPIGAAAAGLASAQLQIEGGIIEGVTNKCTHDLKAKLDSLDIPAEYQLRNQGTHSWAYWDQDIVDSWPTFARAFGL